MEIVELNQTYNILNTKLKILTDISSDIHIQKYGDET